MNPNGRPKSDFNLEGKRFGSLVVLSEGESSKAQRTALCSCECGRFTTVQIGNLKSGHTKSCGCQKNPVKHGDAGTKLYNIWKNMIYRCEHKSHKAYKHYGARGISVCSEWKNYPSFKVWAMGNGYEYGLSIDRMDNDKGYCPRNCQWITVSENSRLQAVRRKEKELLRLMEDK